MAAGSALPLCCACCCWVKIVKPQDYAKSQGCHPAPGEGGRRVGGEMARSGFHHLRPRHLPPSCWPGRNPGVDSVGGASPTPLSHKRPGEGPVLPSRGCQGRPGSGPAPSQMLCSAGQGNGGSCPELVGFSPTRLPRMGPRPGVGVDRAQGGGSREASPWQAASCSACSTPQVTFHQGDRAKLHQAETALRSLPPQGQSGECSLRMSL